MFSKQRTGFFSRRMVVTIAIPMAVLLLGPQAAEAKADPLRLSATQPFDVDAIPVKGTGRPSDLSQGASDTAFKRLVRWPAAASAEVSLAGVDQRAGTMPVWVGPGKAAKAAKAAVPAKVQVSVLDRAKVPAGLRDGMVFRVAPAGSSGQVGVSVDYASFGTAYGGDWAGRLKLVALPECALTDPGSLACRAKPLPSHNDVINQRVTADIELGAEPSDGPQLSSAAAGTGGMLMALTAGSSSSTGDFGASTLQASSTWSAGNNTGDFSWNYPMAVPPALGGAAPSLALAYSSTAVDGRSEATNNQPSWVGQGFEYEPGHIERRYTPCTDNEGGNANNTEDVGDLCWGNENAVMSLNGSSAEFVKDDATGVWKSKSDDNAKIERLEGTVNGAWHNEYWKVTTADGTQYFFGLNRLPGYTGTAPANAETNSTLLVPVAGNNTGERCRQTLFKDSFCNQAWRWNLDYVVDPHGNTMSFWYTKKTNKYAKNLVAADDTVYDREGVLTKIAYGTDNRAAGKDSIYTSTPAPMQVLFTTADRCITTSCGTHDLVNWPDTPYDLECTTADCDGKYTPVFFSTVRLSKITTQVWDAAKTPAPGYKDVNSWALTHNFPPTGSGTPKGLWLESIVRTGHLSGTSISLPEINFDWVALENRVDTYNGTKPTMNWHRMSTIWTETGGKISVRYSDKECVPSTNMPASPETNTKRCYPVLSEDENDNPKTEWFHKYLVTEVYEADLTGGSTDKVTKYEYVGTPAWRFTDDDGITLDKFRTWGEYRGYSKVRTREGAPGQETLNESVYLRGMHGSKQTAAGVLWDITVGASLGNEVVKDENAFAGMVREQTSFNGADTAPISKAVNVAWQSAATATRDMGDTNVYARHVAMGTTYKAEFLDAARGWRTTKTSIAYDSYGMAENTTDWGLVSPDGVTDVSDDAQCVDPTYNRNTGANLLGLTSRVQTLAVACGQPVTNEDQVIGDVRTSYDGLAWGAMPTKGLLTKTESLKSWTAVAGTEWAEVSRATFDAYGRPLDAWDSRNHKTTTAYTPSSGAPVTRVTTTSNVDWTSYVDMEIGNGTPVAKVDANGKRTDLVYDALGRLTKVWLPNRDKASNPTSPNIEHSYIIRNNGGANTVTTKNLNAAGVYSPSYTLYDGLLRLRQTQQPAASGAGGTVFNETIYDAAGRVVINNNYHYDAALTPGVNLVTVLDWQNKSQTVSEYDRAGRKVASVMKSSGQEKWRHTTTYGGDRVYVDPPVSAEAAPTTTIRDVKGRVVELRQHHGDTTGSAYDATTYKLNPKGQPIEMKDSADNIWTTEFDILGRPEIVTDPDKGQTTNHYNNDGDLDWTVDARGEKLAVEYDSLGRKIGVYDDSIAPANKLATWAFDPAGAKGMLASHSRWTGPNRDIEYKIKIRGYTPLYLSTGEDYIIPSAETGLGGTYTFTKSYKVDGSPATVGFPNAGGLGGETLTFTYDAVTGKQEQLQTNWPGAGQYVKNTDFTAYGEIGLIEFGNTAGSWVQRSFNYDEVTRQPSQFTTIRQTAPQIIADVNLTYDAAGNITKVADTPAGGTADTQCFDYDYLRRLEAAWTPSNGDCGPAPSLAALGGPAPYWQSWTMDKVGNRLTQTINASGGNTASTFGHPTSGTARPHAVTSVTTTGPGAGTKNYSYDNSGNQVCRPQPGVANNTCPAGTGSQALSWNSEGLLSQLTSGSSTYDYLYDANADRLIARDATGTTLYLPGNELRRTASTGAVTATRYYNHNGNVCAMRTTSGLTWLAGDHQNTQSIAIAAGNQSVTQRRQAPYGNSRGTAVTWPNPKGFVGGEQDPSGLTHLGAREYDQVTGGFISVDPVIDPADPQQLNAYTYSNNSPVTMSDPDGLRFVDDVGGGSSSSSSTPPPPAKKETGCSAVKLNCTIDDINAMTVVQRKEMVKVWLDVYASKYYADKSFENIIGVLDFMIDDDIAKPGSWSSWVDSTILHGVQNGLAISEGMPVAGQNPGGQKWADYFKFTSENPGVDDYQRRRMWGEAEQAATEYGYDYAASKGVPDGTVVEESFSFAAEVYRWALRNEEPIDDFAYGVGMVFCLGMSARCGEKAKEGVRDLLDPSNHDPTYLGAHVISGAVNTVQGFFTGNREQMEKGGKEFTTYGAKAVKEVVNWLFG